MDIPKFIQLRQHFHKYAETSFNEFQTQQKVREILQESGLPDEFIQNCAQTGLVVDIIGTGQESPQKYCVALRADMDALSLTELNTELPYISVNENAAHMCGHDSHMAMLLSAAHVFIQKRDKLPSNYKIRLLFQPAEEIGQGALKMIEGGCLENVDEVYGIHNAPQFELGQLVCPDRGIMASNDVIEIIIRGQGGHGALPHLNNDVILAGACLVQALINFPSRDINSQEKIVLSVCYFNGGSACNVMPDEVKIKGSLRTLSDQVKQAALRRIDELTKGIVSTYNCEFELNVIQGTPAVINTPENAIKVRKVGAELLGEEAIIKEGQYMASEDFSRYIQEKPGAFLFLGGGRESGVLHSPYYNANDGLIEIGTRFWVKLIEDLFQVELD